VTHFVPLGFPLLLVAPAFALDLLCPRIEGWNRWRQAVVMGAVFVLALLAVQWPMGNFLMSPASRNWIFRTNSFYFAEPPESPDVQNVFLPWSGTWYFWRGIGIALIAAMLSTRIGLARGEWMRSIRR
jgi:hypothetical protein